ncbi:MAG: glutamate-5-semialdehyde dehydrogenase [Nitrospirae bacterium]|nr:MAG: glutamate-5-semialdehyde dehydrogenase [Nitrospirota bacterium]
MVELPIKLYIQQLAKMAKDAARPLAVIPSSLRRQAIQDMALQLEERREEVLEANKQDVDNIPKDLAPEAYRKTLERVRFTEEDLHTLIAEIRAIAEAPDPVGEITSMWSTVDGLQTGRMRVPIGVIAVISEYGPNVTAESMAMCVKTANACIVRGGRDWFVTNTTVAKLLSEAAERVGLPKGAVGFIDRPEREGVLDLARMPQYVNAVIPRGGRALRKAVLEQSRVPILGYDGGASSIYIDRDVDIPLAQSLVVNAKVQDPSASNAVDTVLVHQAIARQLLPGLVRRLLTEFKVELRGCPKTTSLMGLMEMTGHKGIQPATEDDWGQKYQTLTLTIKIVGDLDEGIAHLAEYRPNHTVTIVTRDYPTAMRFIREVDASAVLVNASTRLNSGSQLGIGPEIGTNTTPFHLRGPLTLEALTIEKYVALGTGQLRHPHPVPQAYQDAMMLSPKF